MYSYWLGALALVCLWRDLIARECKSSTVKISFTVAIVRFDSVVMRDAWEFVDCFSLVIRTLRKITRKFNELGGLCVGVLAVWAWLAGCVGWFV